MGDSQFYGARSLYKGDLFKKKKQNNLHILERYPTTWTHYEGLAQAIGEACESGELEV